MNVTHICPHCEGMNQAPVAPGQTEIVCRQCGARIALAADAFDGGRLRRCLLCPSTDLFVRKDFPQRLGVGVVAAGFAVSCVFWYLRMPIWTFVALFVPAVIDFALYLIVGDALMCYRCSALYRDVEGLDEHQAFRLETHEKHRQQLARFKGKTTAG